MKILVLGAGMYVTGKGSDGPGTILPSLVQLSTELPIHEVIIAARQATNAEQVNQCAKALNQQLGAGLQCRYVTLSSDEPDKCVALLLEEHTFDACIVSTPDHTHAAYLCALLQRKVPTLVVKPFVATLEEAKDVLALQNNAGGYGAVEFHKRFDESNLYARQLVRAATLGDPLYITVDYSQRISIPTETFAAWSDKTNIFQYLAVHYVDLIYFITGYLPKRLTAVAMEELLKSRGINTPDSIHVTIEWRHPISDRRLVSVINCNWIDPTTTSAMSDQGFKIIGTKGRLECDQKHRGIELVTEDRGVQHINPYFSDFSTGPDMTSVYRGYGFKSIARFVLDATALINEQTTVSVLNQTRPTFAEAMVSQAVIEAVNQALLVAPAWHDIPDWN